MTTIIKLPLSVQIKLGLDGQGPSNEYVPLAEYTALTAERDACILSLEGLRALVERVNDIPDIHDSPYGQRSPELIQLLADCQEALR